MQLLEDAYNTVQLNEELKQINFSVSKITRILKDEYEKWRKRYGKIPIEKLKQFEIQPEDVNIIATILTLLYVYDKRYTEIFQNNDLQKIQAQLAALDLTWQNYIKTKIPIFFKSKQPINLALTRLINETGVVIPIVNTTDPDTGKPTEYPRYPLHMLHKYIQMNILEKSTNISLDKKQAIEKMVFDDRTRSQLQDDINAYNIRTKNQTEKPLISELPESPRVAEIRKKYQALQ